MFSFGLTWKAYPWIVEAGILKIFYVIASVQLVICLLSIPMCKSLRLYSGPVSPSRLGACTHTVSDGTAAVILC